MQHGGVLARGELGAGQAFDAAGGSGNGRKEIVFVQGAGHCDAVAGRSSG